MFILFVCVFTPSAILYSTHKISDEQIGRNEKKYFKCYTQSARCRAQTPSAHRLTSHTNNRRKKNVFAWCSLFHFNYLYSSYCVHHQTKEEKEEKTTNHNMVLSLRISFWWVRVCGCETWVCAWVFWIFPIRRAITANCWRPWSLLHCDVPMCSLHSSLCLSSSLARSVLSVH